jgi:hypothetical protein
LILPEPALVSNSAGQLLVFAGGSELSAYKPMARLTEAQPWCMALSALSNKQTDS